MRAIDADELKKAIKLLCEDEKNPLNITAIAYFGLLELVDTMPTIEEEALPLQVVTDEYMLQGYLVSDDYFECPNCSYMFGKTEDVMKKVHLLELFKELNFCPKCGQKLMRDDDGNLCYKENK